jgi:hypothetical protein
MFTNISWTNYTVGISLLLVIYYIIIAIRFYFLDLKNLLSGNQKFMSSSSAGFSDVQNNNNPIAHEQAQTEMFQAGTTFAETTNETFLEVEHLIVRLKEAIANASGKKYIKQEFFLFLQLILKEYPMLKNSQFQSVINELIISECAKYGSVTFSEEEVVELWIEVA